MYDNFMKLDQAKRNKIINASLKIFSKTPYKNASTDDIVKEANISKGALYHYFKSKKNLYLYLYDYVIDIMLKKFSDEVNFEEKDIFERYKNIVVVKLALINKHPNLYNFVYRTLYDEEYAFKQELQDKNNKTIAKNIELLLKDIDKSKFRDDIDVDIAIDMIFLTFEGYANREVMQIKNMEFSKELCDRWLREFNQYIDVMKKIYYKGE